MIKKIVEIAHDYLLENNCKDNIAIDFTCGSGNDTKVLAEHVHYVYSYDIQEAPILEAKELCKEYNNVEFHCKSHLYFDEDTPAQYSERWAQQYDADETIILVSSFEVGPNGPGGSLSPNNRYDGWQWILVRNTGGPWTLRTSGFG